MSGPTVVAGRQQDRVAWAVAEATLPGQRQSGDRCLFRPSASGILIAVVDGIGHGDDAAAAATIAVETMEAHAAESPLALLVRCHQELKGTRGVVMTLASLDLRERTLTWLGVGNVEAMLFHDRTRGVASHRALLRNGVIGYHLPALRADVWPLQPRDTLIMVTDGITPDFGDALIFHDDLQRIANEILAKHHKVHDDALVLVARYLGDDGAPEPA